MIKVGQRERARYWGNFKVKKVAQLKKPVVCHSNEVGTALFQPTIVKIEWEVAPSADSHEFWFPYFFTKKSDRPVLKGVLHFKVTPTPS